MKEYDAPLTPNPWSRPEKAVDPRGIVIHWVEHAGQHAAGVRLWFEGRMLGKNGYGSAHDIIDLDGTVWHVIPYTEMAYHVGANAYNPDAVRLFGDYPNATMLGIELTHPLWDGKPTEETEYAAVELCAVLCRKYGIDSDRIVTHTYITGKRTDRGPCHKWYVEHPESLDDFRIRVAAAI